VSYVKGKKTLFARNNGWVDHPDFIGDGHTSICENYQPKNRLTWKRSSQQWKVLLKRLREKV